MTDKETLADGTEGAGASEDSSEEMVSMAFAKEMAAEAANQAVDTLKPFMAEAIEEQGKRTRQSQRDAVKDHVGNALEEATKGLGISTGAPAQPDSTSEPEPTAKSDKADEATQASDVIAGEMTKILEDAGLKGDEPEVKEWLAENKDKPWFQSGQSFFEVAESIKARANEAPIGGGDGSPVAPDNLAEKYVADLREINGRKNKGEISRTQAKEEHEAVKSAAREAGVPVDQIGFGSQGSLARQNEYKSFG